jgi:hypothetical protein
MDVSLNEVLWLAYRNKEFLESLLAVPEKTLDAAQLQLTPDELKALRKMLSAKFVMDGKHILAFANALLAAAGVSITSMEIPKPTPPPPPPPPPWKLDPPLTMPPPIKRRKAKVQKGAKVAKKKVTKKRVAKRKQ